MGYSVQDHETRLRVLEDKIEFVMKTFAVTQRYEHPLMPGKFIQETKTLLDTYRQMKGLGLTPDEVTGPLPEVPGLQGDTLPENVNGNG
jgi:hypothetical protein